MFKFSILACLLILGLLSVSLSAQTTKETKPVGLIEGQVVDADGNAVKGASVTIVLAVSTPADDSKAILRSKTLFTSSDKDGKFKMKDVPVGTHSVNAKQKDKGAGSTSVTVEEGKTAEVKVELQNK